MEVMIVIRKCFLAVCAAVFLTVPAVRAQAAQTQIHTFEGAKNYAVAAVSEGSYVNIREDTGTEFSIVGKLENHGLCYIREQSGDWYRVVSGEVEGYIRQDLLKTGEEAWMEVHAAGEDAMPVASALDAREELVAFACQFVGNPYVWGGTSLTDGADCSGFTQQVFANYGISLPHSSRAQADCGTQISVGDAQPGDLIFYAEDGRIYHVVIYIGNGQAVHASSVKTGIKISDVQYEKASCAVSLL